VTRKSASNERIERKLLKITGSGMENVKFAVPADLSAKQVTIAAFIGEEFTKSLQKFNSPPNSPRIAAITLPTGLICEQFGRIFAPLWRCGMGESRYIPWPESNSALMIYVQLQ